MPKCNHSAKSLFCFAIVSFRQELQVGGRKFMVIISLPWLKQVLYTHCMHLPLKYKQFILLKCFGKEVKLLKEGDFQLFGVQCLAEGEV